MDGLAAHDCNVESKVVSVAAELCVNVEGGFRDGHFCKGLYNPFLAERIVANYDGDEEKIDWRN